MSGLPERDDVVAGLDVPGEPGTTRVAVAMSGGVDSSVVAGLLKHAGYDVVGVTLQLYDHGAMTSRKNACCAGQDIHDARRVSELLGIPHYVLDYEERFRNAVINSFADDYVSGKTPIPCVVCNQKIKFKDLLNMVRDIDAQALATGHYIRSRRGECGMELYRPVDEERDQSHFLFSTTREQLSFLRFPLGGYSKQETRAFAQAMGLSVAEKPDSQDICFVPSGRYASLIEKLRPDAVKPGEIVHMDGRVLGRHAGIVHFTVGQRRGIGVAASEPLYVLRLDVDRQRVVVGPRSALRVARLWLRDVNWLGDMSLADAGADGFSLFVRLRSSGEFRPATLRFFPDLSEESVCVDLHSGDEGVACGQACVFYSDCGGPARVLGGGWIGRTCGIDDVADTHVYRDADADTLNSLTMKSSVGISR